MTPSEIADQLYGEDGNCPFCGSDPYHYVGIGVGMERVAVTCCDEGIGYFQHRDPSLTEQVNLRRQAAATIRAQAEALEKHIESHKETLERERVALEKLKIATEALEGLHATVKNAFPSLAGSEPMVAAAQALARIKETK